MLAQVTPLQRTWELRLRRAGMPAEIRPLTRRFPSQAGDRRGSVVSLAVIREVAAADALWDAPAARHWARFAQAANDLPASWGRRKRWLLAYGECGTVIGASRAVGLKSDGSMVYRWLREFAAWRLVNGC